TDRCRDVDPPVKPLVDPVEDPLSSVGGGELAAGRPLPSFAKVRSGGDVLAHLVDAALGLRESPLGVPVELDQLRRQSVDRLGLEIPRCDVEDVALVPALGRGEAQARAPTRIATEPDEEVALVGDGHTL